MLNEFSSNINKVIGFFAKFDLRIGLSALGLYYISSREHIILLYSGLFYLRAKLKNEKYRNSIIDEESKLDFANEMIGLVHVYNDPEERQKKTDQLLLTSPVSLPGIVAGKYLAAVTVLFMTAGLTLLFVLVVAIYGRVYPAELAVNYLGFILQGCAFAAMDLFLSGCAGTPVTAADRSPTEVSWLSEQNTP